jgi:fructose-bisphosphate aldolase class II
VKVSPRFTIAAAFGNVHGVYKPGNVKLRPEILRNCQEYIQEKYRTPEKPLNLVFHGGLARPWRDPGGSVVRSCQDEPRYRLAVGVLGGVRSYYIKNEGYLQGQIGNLKARTSRIRSDITTRAWLRAGKPSKARLQALLRI